jgi:hypothetical protein
VDYPFLVYVLYLSVANWFFPLNVFFIDNFFSEGSRFLLPGVDLRRKYNMSASQTANPLLQYELMLDSTDQPRAATGQTVTGTSVFWHHSIKGHGSTDLRLDTSTKLKMVNYWWYRPHHKKQHLYLNNIYKIYFTKIFFKPSYTDVRF